MSRHHDVFAGNVGTRGLRRRQPTSLQSLLCALTVLLSATALAYAQPPQQNLGADVYTSAGEITTTAAVAGDAFVAGGRIVLTGPVDGDALVAGGSIHIGSAVGQDVYAAGGEVRIADTVGGNARIAAGRIILEPNAAIEGNLTVFGGNVTLDGSVGGYVLVSAGRTEVNGHIAGDLRVVGGALAIGPEAVVQGRLDYRGPQPATIAPGARIQGGVAQPEPARTSGFGVGLLLIWLIGLILVSAALLAMAPRASRAVSQALRGRLLVAPLLGLALFVGLPLVAGLLMITMVGLPIGVLFLSAWFTLSLLGFFATAITLGDAAAERSGPARKSRRIAAAAIAVLVLYGVGQIPYVGWLVWALAILAGMGGIVLTIRDRLRPAR